MIKNKFTTVVMVLGVLGITGCASTGNDKVSMAQIAADQAKSESIRAEAAAVVRAREQEKMESMINKVPTWALEVPKPDATGVYAVGMSENNTLRVALKQAMLEAEYGLAKTYNQELSGSERSYTQSNGSTTGAEQYTALIDKLVTQVPVSGFEVVRQDIKPIDGKYHAFVLMKLPYAQFNLVLQEQRAKVSAKDKTVTAAFDDLERRIEKRRKQRLEEEGGAVVVGVATEVVKPVKDVTAQTPNSVKQSSMGTMGTAAMIFKDAE